MTLGNDNGTDGQTDGRTDRVRRNMRPPPREEGRIIMASHNFGDKTRDCFTRIQRNNYRFLLINCRFFFKTFARNILTNFPLQLTKDWAFIG